MSHFRVAGPSRTIEPRRADPSALPLRSSNNVGFPATLDNAVGVADMTAARRPEIPGPVAALPGFAVRSGPVPKSAPAKADGDGANDRTGVLPSADLNGTSVALRNAQSGTPSPLAATPVPASSHDSAAPAAPPPVNSQQRGSQVRATSGADKFRIEDLPDPTRGPRADAAEPDWDRPATALAPPNHDYGAAPIATAPSTGEPVIRRISRERRSTGAAAPDPAFGTPSAGPPSVASEGEATLPLHLSTGDIRLGTAGPATNPDLQTDWRDQEAPFAASALDADTQFDDRDSTGHDLVTSVIDPGLPADGRGAPPQPGDAYDTGAGRVTVAPLAQLQTAAPDDAAVDAANNSAFQSRTAARAVLADGQSIPVRDIPAQMTVAAGSGDKSEFGTVSHGSDSNPSDNSTTIAESVVGSSGITAAPAGLPARSSSDAFPTGRASTNLADQLFDHVIGSIANPGGEVVLHLHPPELGDLTVRVVVSGREVSAWFATPEEGVQQTIRQAIGQLHTDLGNAGYSLSGAWVGADGSAARERNARLAPVPTDRTGASDVEAVTPTNPSSPSPSSGVSIYV
jgi:hypothetical protein